MPKELSYDKLTFVYLELPKFTKTEQELGTQLEKWMFVLKNLSRLLERPAALQERVFNRLFEAASIARFTSKQLREYGDSVKAYRDIVNAVNTARSEGLEEGKKDADILLMMQIYGRNNLSYNSQREIHN